MAARGNELIQGMTHADLLDVIHEAIEANVNLQIRNNQMQTETERLRTEIADLPDTQQTQASSIMPKKFTGDGDYSARVFLRRFNQYATYKQWDDAARFRSIPLFLDNAAEIWYASLQPAPANYDQFQQALLQSFETRVSTFVDEQTFKRYTQKPDETVRQYHSRMIEAAERLNIAPNAQLNHFLGSIHPRLKTQVITHNPATLEEALDKARLAEQALTPIQATADPGTLENQIAAFKSKLAEQNRKMQTQEIKYKALLEAQASFGYRQNRYPQRPTRPRPHRSPSPHNPRVRFQDQADGSAPWQNDGVHASMLICTYCNKRGHTIDVCRKKIRADKAAAEKAALLE